MILEKEYHLKSEYYWLIDQRATISMLNMLGIPASTVMNLAIQAMTLITNYNRESEKRTSLSSLDDHPIQTLYDHPL